MTTLIERLRFTASRGVSVWGDLQMEAADELERLTRELAESAPTPEEWRFGIEMQKREIVHLKAEVAGLRAAVPPKPLNDNDIISAIESRGIAVDDPEVAFALVRMAEQLHGINGGAAND